MSRESDYLQLQSTRAKAKFKQTARTLADEVLAPFAIRPFIRSRPWWSLGGAAAAGFVSGRSLRRRGRTPGAIRSGGEVHRLLALVKVRLQRVLKSALGALVVATLRGAERARPAPHTGRPRAASGDEFVPPTNGHGTAPSSKL